MSISPFAFIAIYFAFTVFFIVVIHAIVERLNRRHDNEQSVLRHRIIGQEADLMELRSELQIARAHSDVLQHQRQRGDEHIIDIETRYVGPDKVSNLETPSPRWEPAFPLLETGTEAPARDTAFEGLLYEKAKWAVEYVGSANYPSRIRGAERVLRFTYQQRSAPGVHLLDEWEIRE